MVQLLRSPQFQQALGQLNTALQSGQLNEFLTALGLPASVGGQSGGVSAFLQALQEQSQIPGSSETPEEKSEEEKKDKKQGGDEEKKKDDKMDESP